MAKCIVGVGRRGKKRPNTFRKPGGGFERRHLEHKIVQVCTVGSSGIASGNKT